MNFIKFIVLCFLVQISIINFLYSQEEKDLPKGAEDAGFITAYSNYQVNVPTYYYNDSLYIPLLQTLSFLKIYFITGNGLDALSGYFISKDTTFEIDFSSNKAKFNDREIEFSNKDYFRTNLDIFILPSLLDKIFGLNLRIMQSSLTLYIDSRRDLPILLEDKRKKKYSYLDSKEVQEKLLPLIYGRKWSLLNGGTVNYSLGASRNTGIMNYNYGASFGLQLLGGDFQFNTLGTYVKGSSFNTNQSNWKLRYDFDNDWLSNITCGYIMPMNFRTTSFNYITLNVLQYNGVQISNERYMRNYNFSTISIEDKIAPNWQVELYVNGQLFAQQTTNALGYYHFDLPVKYGNNNLTLKFYGPDGELMSKSKVISVPSDFLPPGTIKYTLGAGKMQYVNQYMGTGSFSLGITDWLTNTINGEHIYKQKNMSLLDHTAIRLGGNLTLSTDYAPSKLLSGCLSLWSDDFGTYNLAYTNYYGASDLNERGCDNAIELNMSVPRIGFLPLNIILRSSRLQSQGLVSYQINSDMRMFLSLFDFEILYNASMSQVPGQKAYLNQDINPMITFNWYNKKNFFSFIDNTRFIVGADYNTDLKRFTFATVSLEQQILKDLDLRTEWRKDLICGYSSLNLTIQMNLPQFRSMTTSYINSEAAPGYTQSLSGMMGFNPQSMDFRFDNSQTYGSIGTGEAKFRFFIDENGNGKYDNGEYEIPGVSVHVSMGQVRTDTKGSTIVYSLPVDERINVTVNTESIKNPLWIPKYKEFAMIADPNSFKQIDVPCYASGIVEGKVTKNDSAQTGQEGVRVHFKNTENDDDISVNVFSDGSYYQMGIPPGNYNVYVDSLQMSLLNVLSEPPRRHIVIASKMTGDDISDINFTLIPKGGMKEMRTESNKEITNTPGEKLIMNKVPNKSGDINRNSKKPDNEKSKVNKPETAEPSKEPYQKIIKEKTFNYKNTNDIIVSADMGKYLDSVLSFLKENPGAKVSLTGHSDNFSTKEKEHAISYKRCQAVFNYLVSKGVDKNRILIKAAGSDYPLSPNSTPEGRAKNRRIEIKVVK